MTRLSARALVLACALVAMAGCGSSSTQPTSTTRTHAHRRAPRRPVHVAPYRKPVPVLMYHEVRVPPPGAPNPGLFVSERTFDAQAAWLARRGYHGVTMAELRQAWAGRRVLPERPIVLTFDDGYASVYRNVVPVLKRMHWPGVLYMALGNTRNPDGVSRAQVERMVHADRWELGSHTISHLDLTTLARAQLREETAGARDLIRRWFHLTPRDFCYPAGRFNATVVAAVKAAGYLGATTTMPGFASPKQGFYTLDRVRIDRGDGANGLATKLASRGAGISAGGE
jgi:peptidoglycan/xylan/chitin deacetylase (PgdA/CDA1 family)